MDMADGEIDRAGKRASSTGVHFDCLSHYFVHPFIFLGIGLGLNHVTKADTVGLGFTAQKERKWL